MFKCFQVLTNMDCNLRCKYCYEHTKNRGKNDPESVKKYLATVLSNEDVRKDITSTAIEFIGGESLLYPKELAEYMELILMYCGHNLPTISISTNGTLFGRADVRDFLLSYGKYISLGISLDGIKECHDLNRVDINGQGSHDSIISNLDFIRSIIPSHRLTVKATFNHDTIRFYKDSILYLISLGFTNIMANTVYEEVWTDDDCELIFDALRDVADYLIANGLEDKVIVSQVNSNGSNYRNLPIGLPKESNHCGSCEHMCCLGMDNKIYGCQRFATGFLHPTGSMDEVGNVSIENIDIMLEVQSQYMTYPEECKQCQFITMCGNCALLPYEFGISSEEWLAQKRQCGYTKAVAYAHCYFALQLEARNQNG